MKAVPGTPKRVLIVDDEPEARLVLAKLCEREGFAVDLVSTAEDAFSRLQSGVPDAAIIDIILPGDVSGYDVARRLKERPGGADVPVIFVSMLGDTGARVEALRVGSLAYFEKPFEWDALVRKLRQLLDGPHPAGGRVLIVDDDEDQAVFLRDVLTKASYDVTVLVDPREFAEVASVSAPELLIIDVNMPGVSGYELARISRQDDSFSTVPIIFITADSSVDAEVRSITSGGDDHLRKPVDPRLLLSSIAARLERARSLQLLVERDGVTGLLTRTAFESHAAALLARKHRARRHDAALVFLDLDVFKSVNDRYGHVVGDAVLRGLGSHLQSGLRESDVIGRFGGEEFIVLLDETSESDAASLFEKLLREFRRINFRDESEPLNVSFSAGVAGIHPGESVVEWQKRADKALYAAKAAGRARVLTSADLDGTPLDDAVLASLKALAARSGVDIVAEVFRMFSKLAPERLTLIERCVGSRSYSEVVAAAHSLRGASANIGARRLSELCGVLEREGKVENSGAVAAILPVIRDEYARVVSAIEQLDLEKTE